MSEPTKTPAKASPSWWAENWKPVLVVMVLGLLPFLPTVLSGNILFASDQMGAPAWKWYFDGLRRGEIPLWDPYYLGGMPTFDANAGSAFYLPLLLVGVLVPVTHMITFVFVLHVLVVGVGAFVLMRKYFRLDRWLSAVLATAYMLNTNYISLMYGGHDGKVFVLTWLPLSLFFLLSALGPRATWKHLLGLALTVAVFVSTSHLQFTYYVLCGYFFVWLYFLIPPLKAKRFAEAGSVALRYWGPVLLGIGLVFFMLYPPIQYNNELSIRGAGPRTTYEHSTSWSMHPEETASLVVPEFGGLNERYWGRNYFKLNSEYPGITVWFLGLLGLLAFRRARWYWLWAFVGVLTIIYGLGAHTPFFRLFYEFVPGVKNFRAPSMMLFWLGVSLLMMSAETLRRLSAWGKESLTDAERGRLAKRLAIGGFSVAGLLALGGLAPSAVYGIWNAFIDPAQIMNFQMQPGAESGFTLGALRAAVLIAVLTWATIAFLLKTRRVGTFALVALAVTVADLYLVDRNFIQPIPPERTLTTDPALDMLKTDASKFRVFGLPGTFDGGVNNHYYGIETVDGRADHEMRHYRQFRGDDYQNNPNFVTGLVQRPDGSVMGSTFLDMLNVKYVAYRVPNVPGIQVVPNLSYLPRAYFVPQWKAVDDSGAWRGIREPGFNPRALAYVTGPGVVSGGAPPDSAAPVRAAEVKEWRYNRQKYVIDAPSRGVLVISDIWFPNWRVEVDGEPATLLRTNFTLRGVMLEPGTHEVTMRYSSPWLRVGVMGSALSALVLALFLVGYTLVSRRRAAAAS
jgi:hypothetical protein